MKRLLTPIIHKHDEAAEPPDDVRVCHVLAGNGLFLHRKHRFFTSCVLARDWPGELADQQPYLELHCPKVPKAAMERIVGFFSCIARLHGTEAAAILFWDRRNDRVCFRIPEQRAGLTEGWSGRQLPTDVQYETPHTDPELSVFGSVHSHVDGAAYASHVDRADESYRTGLHIVVGRITKEPPELHCEYVVDGVRFEVDAQRVIEGYDRRRDSGIPDEWIAKVEVEVKSYKSCSTYYDPSYDLGPARRGIQ
jgi:proteasome lid subunit RPN8/RPN11